MVKIKKIFSILILLYYPCSFFYLSSFNSISELTAYSQQKEEFPLPDNNDYLKPDYTSFTRKETPGAIRRFINKTLDVHRCYKVR